MVCLSMRIRPALSAAFYSLPLFTLGIGAQGADANPKSLYDGDRWFELRDPVERDGAPAFYQGAVASAPNDLRRPAVNAYRKSGVPESVIMAISGHKMRTVFERNNSKDEDDMRKAVNRRDQLESRARAAAEHPAAGNNEIICQIERSVAPAPTARTA